MKQKHLLSYAEAAARYGVSTRKLSKMVSTGQITAYTSPRDERRRFLNSNDLESIFSLKEAG